MDACLAFQKEFSSVKFTPNKTLVPVSIRFFVSSPAADAAVIVCFCSCYYADDDDQNHRNHQNHRRLGYLTISHAHYEYKHTQTHIHLDQRLKKRNKKFVDTV